MGVLGYAKACAVGLLMGSPVAAGGAQLVAALKEQRAWERRPWGMRLMISRVVFTKRWMDDILLCYEIDANADAKEFVTEITMGRFYGEKLKLAEENTKEAFGLLFKVRDESKVECFAKMKFIRDEEGLEKEWGRGRSSFHGGPQFRHRGQDRAIGCGHVQRFLDGTNAEANEVKDGVKRILYELGAVGYEEKDIRAIIRTTMKDTTCDLTDVQKDPLRTSTEERRTWARAYDAGYRLRMMPVDGAGEKFLREADDVAGQSTVVVGRHTDGFPGRVCLQ